MKFLLAAVLCFAAVGWWPGAPANGWSVAETRTITIQHRTLGTVQAVWSQSRTSDAVQTHFVLTRLNKGKLFELTQKGSLWATSGAFRLDNEGDIGFLIVSLVGAKAMDAKVVAALVTGDVRPVAEWSGVNIAIASTPQAQTLIKVQAADPPNGIPKFYAWNGKAMTDVSNRHPELYRTEIEEAEKRIEYPANLPAYYYAAECRDLDLALSYAHKERVAEQWCEKVQERLEHGRYIPSGDDAAYKRQVDKILAALRDTKVRQP